MPAGITSAELHIEARRLRRAALIACMPMPAPMPAQLPAMASTVGRTSG